MWVGVDSLRSSWHGAEADSSVLTRHKDAPRDWLVEDQRLLVDSADSRVEVVIERCQVLSISDARQQ